MKYRTTKYGRAITANKIFFKKYYTQLYASKFKTQGKNMKSFLGRERNSKAPPLENRKYEIK